MRRSRFLYCARQATRRIFVCHKDVAESLDFLRVNEITGVLNICCVEDSHEIHRTGAEKKLFRNQMLYIIQLLLTYDGDIAIYCGRGRSRSPAIIAAYLVVIEGFSAKGAYTYLSAELLRLRDDDDDDDRT